MKPICRPNSHATFGDKTLRVGSFQVPDSARLGRCKIGSMKTPVKKQTPKPGTSRKKAPLVLPHKVDNATWQKRVHAKLLTDSDAKKTFERWYDHWFMETFHRTEKHRDAQWDFLRSIYVKTERIFMPAHEVVMHEKAIRHLQELIPVLRDTIDAVQSVNMRIQSRDGLMRYRSEPLHMHLERAEEMVRDVVLGEGVLVRKNIQRPDELTHCLSLIAKMRDIGIHVKDAVALCKIFMMCHGFSLSQLAAYDELSSMTGRVIKRLNTFDNVHALDIKTRAEDSPALVQKA
jgi:hypothetical protein